MVDSRIRILLVDDHEMARQGLARHFTTYNDMTIVGTAANGEEALNLCSSTHPDIVILDLHDADMDSLTATKRIRLQNPETQVIVLTLFRDEIKNRELMAAGAFRFLLKGNPINELVETIREIKR